jgi:hypothetical protein
MKLLEENIGAVLQDIGIDKDFFFRQYPQIIGNKSKNRQMGLQKTQKFLYSKGNNHQSAKTANICELYM